MAKRIDICENGLYLVFEINEENEIKFLHFGAKPMQPSDMPSEENKQAFRLTEVMVSGCDRPGNRLGAKYIQTTPGCRLRFEDMTDERSAAGRLLTIVTRDPKTDLKVLSYLQFYDGIQVLRSWTELVNEGTETLGIEYVSSFALTGLGKEGLDDFDRKLELRIPHNGWQKEIHWNTYRLSDLGFSKSQPSRVKQITSKTIGIGNTGNWSTKEYLPMAYLANRETGASLFWQIEANGSWYWELSDQYEYLYLRLSGPTEHQSHWWKSLAPGGRFVSVPVSVGAAAEGFDRSMQELTKYRRAIRRPNRDNENLPVIFNDYMNCLWGDPTTARELPLIDRAAEAGCEYYCIDCGWYSDGEWWDGVGEWLPAQGRFPGGIRALTDYIRSKGMVPGLWLEIEVMGIRCPKADRVPDDWYFTRHGKRVYDRGRYQLDFRNPEVQSHATAVIDRLVQEYGIGYIKMDYNIEPGIGTERDADSFGDGLLGHNRAYLAWLDSIFAKYPELVIENCSSGGLRMDYAMLSRYSIQSTSDQEDYAYYATLAANAPSALTPEQAAIWSYPLTEGDEEEVIFNMINAMLLRIHQSGHLANLSDSRFDLVRRGILRYKEMRPLLKDALPYWPLGLSRYGDDWVALGLTNGDTDYLAVWRRNSPHPVKSLPIRHLAGCDAEVSCIYPSADSCSFAWNGAQGSLSVSLPSPVSARLFRLKRISCR